MRGFGVAVRHQPRRAAAATIVTAAAMLHWSLLFSGAPPACQFPGEGKEPHRFPAVHRQYRIGDAYDHVLGNGGAVAESAQALRAAALPNRNRRAGRRPRRRKLCRPETVSGRSTSRTAPRRRTRCRCACQPPPRVPARKSRGPLKTRKLLIFRLPQLPKTPTTPPYTHVITHARVCELPAPRLFHISLWLGLAGLGTRTIPRLRHTPPSGPPHKPVDSIRKGDRVAAFEGTRARQCLFAHDPPDVQHGAGGVYRLVPAGA